MRGDKLPSCEDDPPGGVLLLVACFLQEKFSGGRLKPHVSGRRLQHSELPCVMLWDQRPRGGGSLRVTSMDPKYSLPK